MLANECSGVGHGQRKLVAKAATWSFIYRQALYRYRYRYYTKFMMNVCVSSSYASTHSFEQFFIEQSRHVCACACACAWLFKVVMGCGVRSTAPSRV